MQPPVPTVSVVTEVPRLPPRPVDANKGTFGRVLVVAGSRGMSGAGVLCAGAALRGGAGLVQVAVPEGILPLVAVSNPCYLTAPLAQDGQGRLAADALGHLADLLRVSSAVVVGPGLGQSPEVRAVVLGLLEQA